MMNPPPGKHIKQGHDEAGWPSLSWEVLPRPTMYVIGAVMALVAAASAWAAREFPVELVSLVRGGMAGQWDWFGVAVTGVMTMGSTAWTLSVAGMAYLILFRSRPERFILEGSRLVYEPGSALMALGPGDWYDRTVLRGFLRGRARLEVRKDQFDGASIGSRSGRSRDTKYVLVQAGDRQWRAGQFLAPNEQRWLVEALEEWKHRG